MPTAAVRASSGRVGTPIHSKLLGLIGETQLFPTYLGVTGILSLVCGFIAIEIIGLNFLAAVDWNVIRFIKMLPFLAIRAAAGEIRPDPVPAAGRRRMVADGRDSS